MFCRIKNLFRKRRAVVEALRCQGWTNDKKLSVLYDLAAHTKYLEGDILEIGSAWGRSTVLLGHASGKCIWSIDPHTGGRAFMERGEIQNSYDIFKANLSRNKIDERVTILKNSTAEVMEQKLVPASQKFSLEFIDGLHTAEGVEIDFNFAFGRLVPGGVMVFDDYFEDSIPDYSEMIDRLATLHELALFRDTASRLVFFKKT